MAGRQPRIATEMLISNAFTAECEIERRTGFLAEYLKVSGLKTYVLGISGGVDSTTAGRLAQLAVERLRAQGYEARFAAVRLPYGVQQDEADALQALAFTRADENLSIDVKPAADAMLASPRHLARATPTRLTGGRLLFAEQFTARRKRNAPELPTLQLPGDYFTDIGTVRLQLDQRIRLGCSNLVDGHAFRVMTQLMRKKFAHFLFGARFRDVPDKQVHGRNTLAESVIRTADTERLKGRASARLDSDDADECGSEYGR